MPYNLTADLMKKLVENQGYTKSPSLSIYPLVLYTVKLLKERTLKSRRHTVFDYCSYFTKPISSPIPTKCICYSNFVSHLFHLAKLLSSDYCTKGFDCKITSIEKI